MNCYCNKLRHYLTSRSITTLAPQIVSDPFVELLNSKCCGRKINGSSKRKVSGLYKESGEHRKARKYPLSELAALFVFQQCPNTLMRQSALRTDSKNERPTSAVTPAGLSNNCVFQIRLSQELERQARQLIRLRENRRTGLLQDVQTSQVRGFLRHVHVSNSALRCNKVLSRHTKIGDRGGES